MYSLKIKIKKMFIIISLEIFKILSLCTLENLFYGMRYDLQCARRHAERSSCDRIRMHVNRMHEFFFSRMYFEVLKRWEITVGIRLSLFGTGRFPSWFYIIIMDEIRYTRCSIVAWKLYAMRNIIIRRQHVSVIKQESKPRRVIESYDSIGPSSELYFSSANNYRIQRRFQNVKTEFYKQVVNSNTFPSVPWVKKASQSGLKQ